LTVLCGLSKPNYLLAVLPALGLWLVWHWWRKQSAAWSAAVFGVALPAVVFLAWQYYFAYVNPSEQLEGSSIIFAPFEAILSISGGSRGIMILRFAASIMFPTVVYVCYWRQARADAPLSFAWLTFAIGTAYMYLFAETASRLLHGNFVWGAYITLFVLNFASVRFALKQWLARSKGFGLDWRTGMITAVLVLHVVSVLPTSSISTGGY
jgi:hypothetical protein